MCGVWRARCGGGGGGVCVAFVFVVGVCAVTVFLVCARRVRRVCVSVCGEEEGEGRHEVFIFMMSSPLSCHDTLGVTHSIKVRRSSSTKTNPRRKRAPTKGYCHVGLVPGRRFCTQTKKTPPHVT